MLGISSSISRLSNEAATPSTKAAKVNLAISKRTWRLFPFLLYFYLIHSWLPCRKYGESFWDGKEKIVISLYNFTLLGNP